VVRYDALQCFNAASWASRRATDLKGVISKAGRRAMEQLHSQVRAVGGGQAQIGTLEASCNKKPLLQTEYFKMHDFAYKFQNFLPKFFLL